MHGQEDGDARRTAPRLGERLALAIDALIPTRLQRSEQDLLSARVIVATCGLLLALAAALTGVFALWYPMTARAWQTTLVTMGGLAAGLALALGVLRWTGRLGPPAHLVVATIFLGLVRATTYQGGFDSPALSIFIIVPVLAGLLSGRMAGALWCAAVLAFWVGLLELQRAGHEFEHVVVPGTRDVTRALNLGIACVTASVVVAAYESMNARLRQRLVADRAKLAYLATHDLLTDLPNRRSFLDSLEQGIRRARRSRHGLALLILDLDGFKPVNDRFGHAAGDELLRDLAARLRERLRLTDTVARIGGDEFAVIVEGVESSDDVEVVLRKLSEEVSRPVGLGGETITVRASIGVALFPDHSEDADALQELADTAMYRAKAERRRYCFADPPASGASSDEAPGASASGDPGNA